MANASASRRAPCWPRSIRATPVITSAPSRSIPTPPTSTSVFATRAISCSAREALYVLDGLLENDSILRLHEHSTDTHGFTEQLFGLCYLLGYTFMPRLRDLADQQLYRVDPEIAPEALRPLLRAGLDLPLLGEQWDQLVRVAASLRNRVASAHVVLQRLANASPADRVAKALTTLGRIVKTIYILRYIHEEDLRRRVQLQLNRGESRHALAVLWQPRRVPLGRLRGDHEQGQDA